MTDHIDSDQNQETEFPVGSIVPLSRIQIPQKIPLAMLPILQLLLH